VFIPDSIIGGQGHRSCGNPSETVGKVRFSKKGVWQGGKGEKRKERREQA
jgi:hypothetical protein